MRGGHGVVACLLAGAISLSWVVAVAAPGAGAAGSAGGAASPRGGATPVSGGGGFADAPLVGAGVYADTLLPRETLFYAVSLRAGERLRARATVDVGVGSRSVQEIPDASGGFPTIGLFTPLRQQLPTEDLSTDEAGDDLEAVEVEIESPRVLSASAAGRRAEGNEPWAGPGIYLMAVTISELSSSLGATVELPVRLAIDVDGGPAAGARTARPSPGPLGDPRSGPAGREMAAPRARRPRARRRRRSRAARVARRSPRASSRAPRS